MLQQQPPIQNRFDLSSLAAKTYKVSNDGKNYVFGVCNAAGAPCADKAGACQLPAADNGTVVPLGAFNHYVKFNMTGSPYLEYKTGSVCKSLDQHWSTKIEFICASEAMVEGPVIVENDDCTLVVHFVTSLVCQKQQVFAIRCPESNIFLNSDLPGLYRSCASLMTGRRAKIWTCRR